MNGDDGLTPRERQVLGLLERGLTNADISRELGISFPTAKAHVSSILAKTGAASREDAVAILKSRSDPRQRSSWLFGLIPNTGIAVTAATIAIMAAAVITVGLLVMQSESQRASSERPEEILVPLADLVVDVPHRVDVPNLGNSPYGTDYWTWVLLRPDRSVRAFIARDPHSGCPVPWEPRYSVEQSTFGFIGSDVRLEPWMGAFKGLCSGWVWDRNGEVRFGASPRGLDEFPAFVDGDNVRINLSTVQLGRCRPDLQPMNCSTASQPQFVNDLPPPMVPNWGAH